MLKITAYADRLLTDLDQLDWPESLKEMQRNWIGRSEGAEVIFSIAASGSRTPSLPTVAESALQALSGIAGIAEGAAELPENPAASPSIAVFTTRPDTLFGATYMVLSPEHPLVEQITTPEQREAVQAYRQAVANKSDLERTDLAKSKTGVFTGAYAINPVNSASIPIWIADYVLMGYGTGAIMAVPAHDERDFEFAQKFGLPVVEVVKAPNAESSARDGCFSGAGTAVNSGFLDGPAHRGGQGQDHRLAGKEGRRHPPRPVQAPRLALLPPALLGRALPRRLAR